MFRSELICLGITNEDESNLRSDEHYLIGGENKVWKKIQACARVESLIYGFEY